MQQTTVNACIPYYQRWVKTFPTVKHVAHAPLQRILKAWQGLGYYQRARNIHSSSKIITRTYGGKIPRKAQQLRQLPGFGPYTVGAVLSIAYNFRYPIIDANVRRVMMRLLAIQGEAQVSLDSQILAFLKKILPKKNIKMFNQALMELGALVCRSREPLCSLCPVQKFCKAYARGIQEIIPSPQKMKYRDLDVAIGILQKNKRYFIQKRLSKGLLADLWELPGGKIEQGEGPKAALARELKEECNIDIVTCKPFMTTKHFYTNHRVKLHVSFCEPKIYPSGDRRRRWVTLKEMDRYPMPSGTAKIIEKLKTKDLG